MSDYPMLISNKLHSFRNFRMQRYEKGFWLMSSLTALFVIFSLMLFLYNEYERDT